MFDKYDLTKKTDDKTFAKEIDPLQIRIGQIQREFRDRRVPVVIVFEGWNASGITNSISALIQFLDPRGFTLHAIGSPDDEERARPFFWRFFARTPAKGRIAIFARSWYSRTLAETLTGLEWKKALKKSIGTIGSFERQLADDGIVIIKFFLHISEEEQRKRLDDREQDPLTSWMITKGDWNFHHQYEIYKPVIEEIIEGTDTSYAPWTIVEATDRNYTTLKVYATLVHVLEKRLAKMDEPGKKGVKGNGKSDIILPKKQEVKRRSAVPKEFSRQDYDTLLKAEQERIRATQYLLYKRKIPLAIVYEGWDAAGKGGNIMRLVRYMNPRGFDVMPVGRPDTTELSHHYLWRFWNRFPKAGHITIYDRSWYGRVLVERVERFCTEEEWKRAYNEINEMEETFIAGGGGLVKFWLEISKDEQLRRFNARQEDPLKQWKITDEDWRNREKWDQYEKAVDEMLARTSTDVAPWTVIESDDKLYARVKTLKTVVSYCEELFR